MKVSVIIPSYKPDDYLWKCLDSLYNQTFRKDDYELILVLNGCKDPYERQIIEYLSFHKDLRIIFIQTDTRGVSNARNIALENAKGNYITFIDDDDFVSPSYLEELYEHASPEVVSLCYPLCFEDGTNMHKPYRITNNYDSIVTKGVQDYKNGKKFFSGPVYKLIHRDIIGERRFDTELRNGEDSLFMFLISDKFKEIDFTSRNAIYYRRIRSESAVSTQKMINKIHNAFLLFYKYNQVYWKAPLKYDIFFFFTRLLGILHRLIV